MDDIPTMSLRTLITGIALGVLAALAFGAATGPKPGQYQTAAAIDPQSGQLFVVTINTQTRDLSGFRINPGSVPLISGTLPSHQPTQ